MINQFIKRQVNKYKNLKKQGWRFAYKSVCASAVCRFLGAYDKVKYLHTIQDIVDALILADYNVISKFKEMGERHDVDTLKCLIRRLDFIHKGHFVVVVNVSRYRAC